MSELSPDARDLIAQARKQRMGPSPEQRAQLREKLAPLWAAEGPRPSALGRWRWKIGSVALFAGLGLIGWLYTQAAVEPSVTTPCPDGSSLRAGECMSEAPASTGSVAASGQPLPEPRESKCVPEADSVAATGEPLPEPCARGSSLREGECVPKADSASGSGQQLAAAAPRKVKREIALTRKLAAQVPDVSRPDDRQGPGLAEDQSLAGVQSAALPPEAAAARARRGAQEPSPVPPRAAEARAHERRQPARLPVSAGERTPARAVQTDADPGPPSIDGELELLGAAQSALHKQRPSRALTLLQEHAFRFPSGAMVEERMAMQALALCALQRRHAARTVLANMEARGSQSQLLPRVRSQCGL